ncbi:MAG TPA: pyridoxamine 5'-phosphate oxidase family protein [Anaerolineales bacterium]|nr:pyridoxamine 5'-phosphate oxidase family protein [Anaerolineales bacterium]
MSSSKKLTHDRTQIDRIIRSSQVIRLGLAMADEPYIVPLAFGYDGDALYFHTARDGRKLDFLARNPRVCFEFETNVSLLREDANPCRWSFAFESVIGYGRADELIEAAAKEHGLGEVIRHYAGTDRPFPVEGLSEVRVWRVTIDTVTAKRSHISPA